MRKLSFALLLSVLVLGSFAQQQYTGHVTLIPKGPDHNAVYYTNKISMNVDASGNAELVADLKFGPKSDPGDYVSFNGSITGTFSGDELSISGPLEQAMQDGKKYTQESVHTRVTGMKQSDVITGTFYMRYDGKEESIMTFTLKQGEIIPELLYPLGESPKVFDKGWKFGASFTSPDGDDLSENIKWSGTATFKPDKGPVSNPVFNNTGKNAIKLSVTDKSGNKFEKEYEIQVVAASNYAHSGCYAICKSDAHGCIGCPHPTTGYITGSATEVTIKSLPVAVVGDHGRTSGCCGANTFELTEGDPEVLINGKEAVLIGATTTHCGGMGIVSKSIPPLGQVLSANDSVYFIDPWGEKKSVTEGLYERLDTKYVGTTYIVGNNGSMTMSLLPNGLLTAGPNTQLKFLSDQNGVMTIQVDKGSIYFNGHATGTGKVVIQLKDCGLELKGTRFSLKVDQDQMKLDLLEGAVDFRLSNGEFFGINEGESIVSDYNSIVSRGVADTNAVHSFWNEIAHNAQGSKMIEVTAVEKVQDKWWSKYLTLKWLLVSGGGLLLIILILLVIIYSRRKKSGQKPKNLPPLPPVRVNAPDPKTSIPTEIPKIKFCPVCGNQLSAGIKFCGKCGYRIL